MRYKNINPLFFEKTKDGETFYDVYARLVKDRVIFLAEEIDSATASIIVALLFLLDREDKEEEPISLWINSPGGDADNFFAIYDMIQLVKAPVKTVCLGSASSAAAMLLAAGSPGLRYATPNSHVMIHQIQVEGVGGTGTEVEIEAREVKKVNNRITEILARHTGQTMTKIRKDCQHDKYLDAQGAMEYGIIDHILGPTKTIPELKQTRRARKKKPAAKKPESAGKKSEPAAKKPEPAAKKT
jgi:ATP-dependent Clp protease protease subunit